MLRSIDQFPQQGVKRPWRLHQNYARDRLLLHHGPLEDGAMEFSGVPGAVPGPARIAA